MTLLRMKRSERMNRRGAALTMTMMMTAGVVGTDAAMGQDGGVPRVPGFKVREGYVVSVAVSGLPGARFLESDGGEWLFVSRPQQGDIHAMKDEDGDGLFEKRVRFVSGKPTVHGMDWHDGWLWFTTSASIHKARDTDGDGVADEVVDVIGADKGLPRGGGHWWRSLLVTEKGLYTSIGDGGNISDQTETERQKIWRFDLEGGGKALFCSGIRNNEKLRLRPGTDELWGCDHGSDWFGKELGDRVGNQPITDVNPPEEVNKYVEGGFYGHPFVVGNRLVRYEYLKKEGIHELAAKTIVPEWSLPAHWACNGFAFLEPGINEKTGAFPKDHEGDMFVAAHGSWNSTKPVGYCVCRVLFDGGKPYGMLEVVTCVTDGGGVLGRPVDVVQMGDGSLLFSCDQRGAVYRIVWKGVGGE